MVQQPFYDPALSYDQNFQDGPFGAFVAPTNYVNAGLPGAKLLGHKLYTPFGIAAGPLINSTYIDAAFKMGFDVVTYKNVRTKKQLCHPSPNVLPFDFKKALTPDKFGQQFSPGENYEQPLSILNSCGVPSLDPDFWQPDMRKGIESAGVGQVMIAGIQGTERGEGLRRYLEDNSILARLIKEVDPPIVELNTSCPNEGHSKFLCYDVQQVTKVVEVIKNELGNTPLIVKVGYYQDERQLEAFVQSVGSMVQGIVAINSIQVTVKANSGSQPFPGRDVVGASGYPIKWAGLSMVRRLNELRTKLKLDYAIMGIGGVLTSEDYLDYRVTGADVVQSATGAIWNPLLAQDIKRGLTDALIKPSLDF